MLDSSPSDRLSAIVERLRAAGCVFAEDEARLLLQEERPGAELAAMVERRASGLPLEQVLGWARFRGLRLAVTPGVFVPRRRTEFLVEQAVALARPGAVVLDLCCGVGAVGAALLATVTDLEVHAVDIDAASVACARRNLAAAGAGQVYHGDLYQPLPSTLRGRVDVLVANAPYVPTGQVALLPAEARLHEPRLALDGGVDGLAVARRIAEDAPRWLAPGGHLVIETSARQASRAVAAIARAGLLPRVAHCERRDATVVIARERRPPVGGHTATANQGSPSDRPR